MKDILNYSIIHNNTIALSYFFKNYYIDEFDLSLALEKYFELDNIDDIYIDYIIKFLEFKKQEFLKIFISKIEILKDDKLVKADKLVQKILKSGRLYEEDFEYLFIALTDKITKETLSTLAEKVITKEKK